MRGTRSLKFRSADPSILIFPILIAAVSGASVSQYEHFKNELRPGLSAVRNLYGWCNKMVLHVWNSCYVDELIRLPI